LRIPFAAIFMVSVREAPVPPVSPKIDTWQLGTVDASVKLPHAQAALAQQIRADRPMLANSDVMKQRVREALPKHEYNVADFYHKTGIWRTIATNPVFENITLLVIFVNALWIAIDTDMNPASTLLDAEPIFQIVDHAFCWYFSFEWYVRFSAFKRKRDGMKDAWFCFDSCLVFMMVAETWVMTIVLLCLDSGGGGGLGGASILRLFRLLRLSRLARMLRSMPELMILIKGMLAASRSVFFTMCLLVILLYLFAIALRQITEGSEVGEMWFHSVPAAMYKLLIEGVFLDNLGATADTIAESSPVFAVVFFIFVCMAALMVMNMLIGVLCEVVSAVAATEKEEMNVLALRSKLAEVMLKLDTSGNGRLSQEEFVQLVSDAQAVKLLDEMGIDPISLIDMAPTIFEPREDDSDDDSDDGVERLDSSKGREIDFQEFMKVVLDLRGSNAASLKDLRELKNDLVTEMENLKVSLNVPTRRRSSLTRRPSSIDKCVSEPALATERSMAAARSKMAGPRPSAEQLCGMLPGSCGADARGSASPPPPRGSRGGEAGSGLDMQEVHVALCSLQLALARAQRPSPPGAASAEDERERFEWLDSMSRASVAHLERLQRMQRSCIGTDA